MSSNTDEPRSLRQIAAECFDNSIRVELAFHTAFQADRYADAVEELFEDVDEAEDFNKLLHHAHPGVEVLTPSETDHYLSQDEIGEVFSRLHRHRIYGFFAKVATPIPHNIAKDKSSWSSSGFGRYTTTWFFTEQFDDAFFERLKAWRDGVIDRAWQKEHGDAGETTTTE